MTKYLTEKDAKSIWADMKEWVSIKFDRLLANGISSPDIPQSSVEDTEELTKEEIENIMELVFIED